MNGLSNKKTSLLKDWFLTTYVLTIERTGKKITPLHYKKFLFFKKNKVSV